MSPPPHGFSYASLHLTTRSALPAFASLQASVPLAIVSPQGSFPLLSASTKSWPPSQHKLQSSWPQVNMRFSPASLQVTTRFSSASLRLSTRLSSVAAQATCFSSVVPFHRQPSPRRKVQHCQPLRHKVDHSWPLSSAQALVQPGSNQHKVWSSQAPSQHKDQLHRSLPHDKVQLCQPPPQHKLKLYCLPSHEFQLRRQPPSSTALVPSSPASSITVFSSLVAHLWWWWGMGGLSRYDLFPVCFLLCRSLSISCPQVFVFSLVSLPLFPQLF